MNKEIKPKKNAIFYWLGGFILLCCLALAGQFFYWKYKNWSVKADPQQYPQNRPNEKVNAAIQDYLTWCDRLPSAKMNEGHEIYQAGLDKIANVLSALSVPNAISTSADVRLIHLLADSLTYDRKSVRHTDMIKHAFLRSGAIISALQFKGLAVAEAELGKKVDRINVNIETLRQQTVINAAFQQTAVVFRKIVDQLPKKPANR